MNALIGSSASGDPPWRCYPLFHERERSHVTEVLLAGIMAQEAVLANQAAQQQRVEEDVVRRGRAAAHVWRWSGDATLEMQQSVAEALQVLQMWEQRRCDALRGRRVARRVWAAVIGMPALWILLASPSWPAAVVFVAAVLLVVTTPRHPIVAQPITL